jgi:hypothetical protein
MKELEGGHERGGEWGSRSSEYRKMKDQEAEIVEEQEVGNTGKIGGGHMEGQEVGNIGGTGGVWNMEG